MSSGGRGDVDEDDHEYDYPVDSLAALKLSAAAAAVNGKHGQNNTKTYLNSRNNNGIGQTRKPWTVDLLSSSVFLPIEHCLSISTALLSADLFKATNDAKQNWHRWHRFLAQYFMPFQIVISFVWIVCPRNHFLTGGNSLTDNQKLLLSWFSKPTLRAKWIPPCERAWKTMPENGVRSCVHFCLRSL